MYWFVVIGGHVATITFCLFCFLLAARLVGERGGAGRVAAWFAFLGLSFLALAGEPFYKYVGLLPILAAAGLAAVRSGRWRAFFKLSAASLLALAAAKILMDFLQAQGFHIVALNPIWEYLAGLDTITANLYTYARSLWILLGAGNGNLLWLDGAGPFVLVRGFLGLRLLTAVVAVLWTGKIVLARKSSASPENAFIDSVLLAGVGLDSAAYLFSTMPGPLDAISTFRYLVPAMVYASILVVRRCGPSLSARWSAARPRMRAAVPAVFFTALLLFVPRILEVSRGQPNAAELQLAGYLAARGLHSGYGGYWQSNIITFLSWHKVKVAGLTIDQQGKIAPFHWLSKADWYDAPANFVVYDPSDANFNVEAPAIKTFGPPAEIASIDRFRVLIWNRDIHSELDRPDLDLDAPDLVKFPLDLLRLHRQSLAQGVQLNDDGSIVDDLKYSQAKPIVYGPYIHLPASHYRVTFVLSAGNAVASDSISCDTTIRLGAQILARAGMSGRDLVGRTTPATITLSFNCPGPQDVCEFRLWKTGGLKLTLLALTLTKD